MLKKILIMSAVCAATTGVALANPAPYVGASIGSQTNTATKDGFGKPNNHYGAPISVFGGYGGVVSQNIYLAGELFAKLATANVFSNSSSSGSIKSSYGYGASIIPGLMLSDHTLAFGRAGVVRSRFTSAQTVMGAQFGLGMQTSLSQNVDLRGEYDVTSYRSFNSVSKLRAVEATAGLIYKFD